MKWLESFKIAIIEEDITTIDELLKQTPEFKKIEDMREAYTLIGEAKKKFEKEQKLIQQQMNKIEKTKKFLSSVDYESRLDEVY